MIISTRNKSSREITCPYCGMLNCMDDLYNESRGEGGEAQCYECERTFSFTFHVSISVTASTQEKQHKEVLADE